MSGVSEKSLAVDERLSVFEKILLATDGTVTQLLEIYSGEPIRVQKLEQTTAQPAPEILRAAESTTLKRTVLLRGESRVYLHAESFFALERLTLESRRALLESEVPIGQLWRAERLETYREIVHVARIHHPIIAAYFGLSAETELLTRSYLVHAHSAPIGLITESFPLGAFV